MNKLRRNLAFLLAVCLMITCGPSVVTAKKAHTLGNTVTNQFLDSMAAENEGRIYYGIRNKIYSVKTDGTGKKEVYTVKGGAGENGFSRVAVYGGFIYALYDSYGGSDGTRNKLVRVKPDGSGFKSFGYALTAAAADGKIYYTKAELVSDEYDNSYLRPAGVYSMNPDGSSKKALVKKKDTSVLAIDGADIYYQTRDSRTGKLVIYCCGMNGKKAKKLVTIDGRGGNYALSGSSFFYSEETPDDKKGFKTDVYRLNMKSGKTKKVYTCKSGDTLESLFIEGNSMYLATYDEGLKKINLETKKETTLVSSSQKSPVYAVNRVFVSVIVYERYREDMKNGTNISIILAKKSNGKKIKEIGAYFTS